MKKHILLALIALISFLPSYAGTPVQVQAFVDEIYVPYGFDDNDNSQIIVAGYLPNLCHKSPSSSIEVDGKNIVVQVETLKYHPSNPFCPEMIVPFLEVIDLGVLSEGLYSIVVNPKAKENPPKEAKLLVQKSQVSDRDNHIYAAVEFIDVNKAPGVVALKGHNPSDCVELDRIEILSNGSNAYSIMPIMKQVSDYCPVSRNAFEYEVEVPKSLQAEKILLHVRSLQGESVNALWYNKRD